MKPFLMNNTFMIAMGTGLAGSNKYNIDAFKKAVDLGVNVISSAISLHNNEIVLVPEKYNYKNDGNNDFISLDHMINEFPDTLFNFVFLDKNNLLIERFCDFVLKNDLVEKIIIRSVYKRNIKKIKSIIPHMACAFALSDQIGFFALYKTGLIGLKKKYLCDAIMTTEMMGTSYFASPGLISAAKKMDLKVYIIGAKKEVEIEKLSLAGVDGFFTEDIEDFIKICSKLKLM